MEHRISGNWLSIAMVMGVLTWLASGDFTVGIAIFGAVLMPAVVILYVGYAKDNPKRLWFKRKLYGWGWTPVTWQGWLSTLVCVGLLVFLTLRIDETSSARELATDFIIPGALITAVFMIIAYRKGERPRWQWGRKSDDI